MRCLLATTTVTYQSSVPQLYIALHSSDHCWLISSFGLVTSHSPWSAVVTVLELECWNSYFNFNSQQAQSLWLLPPPTPTSPPRFFLFFNWWKLKATIKEKQKDLVKLIAFLTLCYHISIQNLVEMFSARRGIMMTHTARILSSQHLSMIFQCSNTHTFASALSQPTFSVFLGASFLCPHSELSLGYD